MRRAHLAEVSRREKDRTRGFVYTHTRQAVQVIELATPLMRSIEISHRGKAIIRETPHGASARQVATPNSKEKLTNEVAFRMQAQFLSVVHVNVSLKRMARPISPTHILPHG